jgi:hypothetical protein
MVSCVGYEHLLKYDTSAIGTLSLTPIIYPLQPVQVRPFKSKKLEIRKSLITDKNHAAPGAIRASYIPNPGYKDAFVKELFFHLEKPTIINDSCFDLVRIHVYSYDTKTHLPSMELLKKDMVIELNTHIQIPLIVNIADNYIPFPPEGIVLGYEYLGTYDRVNKELNLITCNDFAVHNLTVRELEYRSFFSYIRGNIGWKPMQNASGENKYFLFTLSLLYR